MSSQTVETRLHSLPKFLRSEPSPKIQDSAFPPFKIEHRYRGVYERAGFDVNLGSNDPKHPRRNPSPPYSSASSKAKQAHYGTNNNGTHHRQRLQQLMHSYQSRLQRLLPSEKGYNGSSHVQTRLYGSSGDLPEGYSAHLPTKSVALVNLAPLARLQQSQMNQMNQMSQTSQQNQQDHQYYQQPQQQVQQPQIAMNPYEMQPQYSEPGQVPEEDHSPYEEPQGERVVHEQYDPRKQARAMRNNSTTKVAEHGSSADLPTSYQPVPRIEETLEMQNANRSVDSVLSTSAVVGATGGRPAPPMPYPTAPYPHENDSGHSTYVFSEPNHTSLSTAYSSNLNYNSKYDSFDFSPQQEPSRNFNDLQLDLNQPVEMEPYQENDQLASYDANNTQDNERHRLSHELANFKRDVEDHKAYTPISPPLPNSARQGPPQLPTASPTELGLARFEPYKSPVPAIVTTMDDGTVLRNSTDYERFLKSDSMPPRSTMRQSQFSTVSSIISKDGQAHYDDDHESEDEVERELERQLRSLTVGDDTEASPAPAAPTEQKLVDDEMPTVATPNSEYPNDSDVDLNAEDSRRLSIKPLKTERIKSIQSEVKPLSPKVHQIDEELRGMNLGRDPIIPEDFENSEEVFPPGRGPCRCCKRNIEANATGKEKSVYSRTGELTGQWHRGCFQCSYSGCEVKFKKSVPCYAFNDRPYCSFHYHEVNGSLCTECGSGIEGECIENELEQKWHISCLRCEHCSLTIRSDYYLINGTTYCETDALAIINGQSYSDADGNLRGLSTTDRIEKRRTRMMYVEL